MRLRREGFGWAVALVAGVATSAGCGDSACDKAVSELAALRPDTIKSASPDLVMPWQTKVAGARATCAAEKHPDRMEKIAEVEHAIEMRAADLAIAEAERAAAARSASAAPPPPPKWTVHCSDVVHEGGFHGLPVPGLPKGVGAFLVPGSPAGDKPDDADAGAEATPQEALVLGGRPVYLSARGGKLEGSVFDGRHFSVQRSLGWPPEAAREGLSVDRIVAARGEGTLAIAWVSDLRAFFAVLDLASERWSSFAELPVSGDDGGRDLAPGDLVWGRASFGLTLTTARGFAFVEVLQDGRMARPAKLQPAFVAGVPRVAWDGQQFLVAAGRADGVASMGVWRAPNGATPPTYVPLLEAVPGGASIAPLTGELAAGDGAVHLAFQVKTTPIESVTYLGHASGAGQAALEKCP